MLLWLEVVVTGGGMGLAGLGEGGGLVGLDTGRCVSGGGTGLGEGNNGAGLRLRTDFARALVVFWYFRRNAALIRWFA